MTATIIVTWLSHGISTYLLHSQHGNGYAWWSSGPGPGLGQVTLVVGLVTWWLHTRCDNPRCVRKGKYQTADGHHKLCRGCHTGFPNHRLSLAEILERHEQASAAHNDA